MILKLIFVIVLASQASGGDDTPGVDEYLHQTLSPSNRQFRSNIFDEPGYILNAPTAANKNKLPTLDQMMYYNYHASAIYYGYEHANLTCQYCLKFKDNVAHHKVINNKVHNTLALVTLSKTRQEIVVAFRGMTNVWNTILYISSFFRKLFNGPRRIKYNQGIHILTMSLYDDVVEALADLLNKNPGFKVVLTGHSMGASLARLTYFFFANDKLFPGVTFELYTYGEPRVGNKYFAEFMNRQPITTVRVVAGADLYPHIMPILGTQLPTDYYIHPQTEFWINGEAGQRFCSRTVYEDPKCSMSMGPAYNASDHILYFDTNLTGVVGQPLLFAALPFNLFDPFEVPPLPKPIENLIVGVVVGLA